jgi:hypothetical protein
MRLALRAREHITVEVNRTTILSETLDQNSVQIAWHYDLRFALFVAATNRIIRPESCQTWLSLFPAVVIVGK